MELNDKGCEDLNLIQLVQDLMHWVVLVNTVMTIKTENFLASAATVSFSRREFFH
jgi:hypothetical protein